MAMAARLLDVAGWIVVVIVFGGMAVAPFLQCN